MLALNNKTKRSRYRPLLFGVIFIFLVSGLYILSLMLSPSIAPLVVQKPIVVTELPTPIASDNRIVIPKLGVNIHYAPGEASLDRGAQWRYPERGNPELGGNFIIAAHRFSIQPTPMGTIEKSQFYNLDKLTVGDKIIVDYKGTRSAYDMNKKFDVNASDVSVENNSDNPMLTLYSCELGGSDAGRIVVTALPMGKVALD